MTKMTEPSEKDLKGYIKKTLWSATILLSALGFAWLGAYFVDAKTFFDPLLGALLGAACATINLFALGYAFFVVVLKEGKKLVLLLPIGSFAIICLLVFLLTKFWSNLLFGFALGLAAPVLFGAVVAWLG